MNSFLNGRYRLKRLCESYPWGDYWEAESLALGDEVMVLEFSRPVLAHPHRLRIALAMAGCWRRLIHEGVIRVLDICEDPAYVVTEPLPGSSLCRWLEEDRPERLELANGLVPALARAVGGAGSLRVYHLCLNPRSIFLGPDGEVKVGNFGFGHILCEAPDLIDPYHRKYLAPEQESGGVVGPFTDVYGAAMVLFEVICGSGLFEKVSSTPEPRSLALMLPEPWRTTIHRGLAPDPRDRYQAVEAMASDLGVETAAGDSWTGMDEPGRKLSPLEAKTEPDEGYRGQQGLKIWLLLLILSALLAVVTWFMVLR